MSIGPMSPEALRRYIQTHHEKQYLLVDVRQPEEYRRGHIPGARLIPLPELVKDMDQLPADKELVFYCQVGGRSMAAAAMVEEEGWGGAIHNLSGGLMAWDGGQVADLPRVRLFEGQSVQEMFRTAMDLEKGAQIFYETVGARHAEQFWGPIFARLAKAEWAHAKAVHGFWQQVQPDLESFEPLFEAMPGEILEGGIPLQQALEKLADPGDDTFLRLIELALQIEYAAFDLYRTLADQHRDSAIQEAFTSLAQSEKAHMQSLIEAMAKHN
ncbi:MAG: sulfurtransferase [Desulfatitalea sp.]|nr:sulfurtransferase [Desulfatitalea sp.]